MWEEIERSPVLAAPDFNNCVGLTATSTNLIVGEDDEETQAANDLCLSYLPLAYKIAGRYRDKGINIEDLRSAGVTGLVLASRKFNPHQGAFGSYAEHWIKGEITALFKSNDALALSCTNSLTIWHNDDDRGHQRDVAAPSPTIAPDLGALAEADRNIIQARDRGETLAEIGKVLGISPERVRQREARARSKIRGIITSECLSDLTKRGEVIRHPRQHTRRTVDFRDREPPKHTCWEPKPSREILHHRANASRLADLRGNEPLRNPRGPYGGPVIHGWGSQ
jgi:RNA polymerase sigma factor (sigma-70 family)